MGSNWLYSCFLWDAAFRIGYELNEAFLLSSHQARSPSVLLYPRERIHTLVLTRPLLEIIPLYFIRKQISYAFPMHFLTSLFVDKIFLPMYMNMSTNLGRNGTSLFKPNELCFISIQIETNVCCCLLQAVQQRFSLDRYICHVWGSIRVHLLWVRPCFSSSQHEHTFSSYVRIRDVVLKTYLRRWTIGRSGERGSGISVLPARYDDDDICHIYQSLRSDRIWHKVIFYAEFNRFKFRVFLLLD